MDRVQELELAYDLANNIINHNYFISNRYDEIREVLNNQTIMDAILENLNERMSEEFVWPGVAEAELDRFIR